MKYITILPSAFIFSCQIVIQSLPKPIVIIEKFLAVK
jgi:hypothetical protein